MSRNRRMIRVRNGSPPMTCSCRVPRSWSIRVSSIRRILFMYPASLTRVGRGKSGAIATSPPTSAGRRMAHRIGVGVAEVGRTRVRSISNSISIGTMPSRCFAGSPGALRAQRCSSPRPEVLGTSPRGAPQPQKRCHSEAHPQRTTRTHNLRI